MKNQTSVDGAASPKLQQVMSTASNENSGQGPVADSSTGTPAPADLAVQSGAPGTIEPDSVKTGHD